MTRAQISAYLRLSRAFLVRASASKDSSAALPLVYDNQRKRSDLWSCSSKWSEQNFVVLGAKAAKCREVTHTNLFCTERAVVLHLHHSHKRCRYCVDMPLVRNLAQLRARNDVGSDNSAR